MSDVVTAAVIRESFASTIGEMRRAVARSSCGSIIYEGYDFPRVPVDAAGKPLRRYARDSTRCASQPAGSRSRWASSTSSPWQSIRSRRARFP